MYSNRKSFFKTMSWRVIATIEFWAKLVLYYGHKRLWAKVH